MQRRDRARSAAIPARVTVFGESRGRRLHRRACSRCPPRAGCSARAIVQSAAPEGQLSAAEARRARADCSIEKLGGDARRPRLAAQPARRADPRGAGARARSPARAASACSSRRWSTATSLPERPLAAIAARRSARGRADHRHDRRRDAAVHARARLRRDPGGRAAAARGDAPARPARDRARARRRRSLARLRGRAPPSASSRVETDASLFVPSTRLAEAQSRHQPRTFMYRFTWRSPLQRRRARRLPRARRAVRARHLRACPKVRDFAGAAPDAERVAHAMMDAWVAFARSGDPSHAGHPRVAARTRRRAAPRSSSARPAACSTRPDEARRRAFAEGTAMKLGAFVMPSHPPERSLHRRLPLGPRAPRAARPARLPRGVDRRALHGAVGAESGARPC